MVCKSNGSPRSRFTSLLLGILNGRFKGDAQNDIESWERDIRRTEKQTSFAIPDFVKAGILINGLQEEPLRRHMVLHPSRLDTYEKLLLEVTEIARAKVMSVNPVPMDVDALHFKGKGKGKTKDHKEKGKANKEKGAHSKSLDPQDVECNYCEKGHKKSVRSAKQILRRRRVVLRCLLKLSTRFRKSACRRIELQAADGSPVEHYGSKDVFYMVGNEAMKVRFEVTSVKAPILSLAALEDAGWRLGHQNDRLVLRRGDLSLQVDRVDNVYWLFGLEGLGRVNPDLVADRVCGLEEIELERQQVRRPELLPEEHNIHPRSKPLPKEPSIEERRAHELTHLPTRSWCETCVKSFGLEDPQNRLRGGRDLPELQVDCMFMGRRGEKELICALHAIDTEFLARTVIRADKGPIDFLIHGILEFLSEIGRKRMVIRSDNEPAVKALVQAVALHREDETRR